MAGGRLGGRPACLGNIETVTESRPVCGGVDQLVRLTLN